MTRTPAGWNIIWQLDPEQRHLCIERDWFRYLFNGIPVQSETVDWDGEPLLAAHSSHSLVCASCPNLVSPESLGEYLQTLPRPRVLYHMSDEFLKAGAELYAHCDLVIRNGSALFSDRDDTKLLQLPLGYSVGFENQHGKGLQATRRPYTLAFLGKMKHERKTEMLPAFQSVPGKHYLRETMNWKEALQNFNHSSTSVYQQAIFVPCPKGNWNPECNRLYDALEWGCIPLVRNYTDTPYQDRYHDKLLGTNPLPQFDDWSNAADFANSLLGDSSKLDALQAEIFDWWQGYKINLKRRIEFELAKLDSQP